MAITSAKLEITLQSETGEKNSLQKMVRKDKRQYRKENLHKNFLGQLVLAVLFRRSAVF